MYINICVYMYMNYMCIYKFIYFFQKEYATQLETDSNKHKKVYTFNFFENNNMKQVIYE